MKFIHQMALAAACLIGVNASAQSDARVYRIIVPISAGTPFDAGARALAEGLRQVTGRNYIVENKPGAGGTLGTAEVAKSKPDGTTLLYTTGGHATAAGLYAKLPYDPIKSFTPITLTSESRGFALVVREDSPFKSARELIDAAKEKPGTLSYGSMGIGNTTHIVGAMFARSAGINLLHVPYSKGLFVDLLSGQIDMMFQGSSNAYGLLKGGKIRVLATSNPTQDPTMPTVPTFKELGVDGVNVPAWAGVLAPAGMSKSQAKALYEEIVQASHKEAYVNFIKSNEANLVMLPPAEFSKKLTSEVEYFKKEIPALGIRLE